MDLKPVQVLSEGENSRPLLDRWALPADVLEQCAILLRLLQLDGPQ